MLRYRYLWPIIRQFPPELVHNLALRALRLPVRLGGRLVDDPFAWKGLTFRNRAGVAAGFDKNAESLAGLERLGAGFVEVGTILVEPWPGNQVSPRMARLMKLQALWNRLGFTSLGLQQVERNLAQFPRKRREDMVVACNIGPHPGNLKHASNRNESLSITQAELLRLSEALFPHADLFVVNLSSPNTPGLRSLLQTPELTELVVQPIRRQICKLDEPSDNTRQTPLLIKLPPEDENREPWTKESLGKVVQPLLAADACDGFVAVNTSTRLALEHFPVEKSDLPGGISGDPLREEALRVVGLLRQMIGPSKLLIGCGGIMAPGDAKLFRAAGADLVELYSGMVFSGPSLVGQCAEAMKKTP